MHGGGKGEPIDWFHPSTWPVFVWIWAAFVLYGFVGAPAWKWWRKQQGQSWPMVPGTILYGAVEEKSGSRSGPHYDAQIFYEYFVDGQGYTGKYTRRMSEEDEAEELIRDLRGRVINVHVHPRKAKSSWVSDEETDRIAAERPPKTDIEPSIAPSTDRSVLHIVVAAPFALLSLVGLALSMWVHFGAVLGKKVAPEWAFTALHIGVFVVFIPGIFMLPSLGKKDWRRLLRSQDAWLNYSTYVLFAYAGLNFFYGMLFAPAKESGPPSAATWRLFSGHWMVFYFVSFAMHYVNGKYGGLSKANASQKTLKIFDN